MVGWCAKCRLWYTVMVANRRICLRCRMRWLLPVNLCRSREPAAPGLALDMEKLGSAADSLKLIHPVVWGNELW